MTPEEIARQFHDTYERLAPTFGYQTRQDTRSFDPESPNGRLMIAVCDEVLTALREKLATVEASLAERARMLETTRRVQRAYRQRAYRATVAAALAELRTHWNAQYQHYVSMTDDSSWERRQELLTRMHELDAIIAKLDLPEAAPASCTWTLDDDGNYATGCDGLFVVLKDSLAGYQMASCCFCGRPIKEQQ